MHSPSFPGSKGHKSDKDVLLSIASLVTEGRIPEKIGPTSKGFREGPHCLPSKEKAQVHCCDAADSLCANYEFFREEILRTWVQNLALSLEFILTCGCPEGEYSVGPEVEDNCILLETWNFRIIGKRNSDLPTFQLAQLMGAIRSQLYFSQITAWLTTANDTTKKRLTSKHLRYRIIQPGDSSKTTKFMMNPVEHNFPTVTVNNDTVLKVSFCSLPRMSHFPLVECPTCIQGNFVVDVDEIDIRDKPKKFMGCERIPYTSNGKHYCDDNEQLENGRQSETLAKFKRLRHLKEEQASTSTINHLNSIRMTSLKDERKFGTGKVRQTKKVDEFLDQSKEDLILDVMDRVGLRNHEKLRMEPMDVREMQVVSTEVKTRKKCNINKSLKENDTPSRHPNRTFSKKQLVGCVCDNFECDKCKSDKNSCLVTLNRVDSGYSDSIPILNKHNHAKKVERLTCGIKNFVVDKEIDKGSVPSVDDQTKFKKILNSSASMLFHKTGLPLMSSPAPVRKGKTCFDFDPSLKSATDIKRAFFSSSLSTDEESESDGSQMSPCSPETYLAQKTNEEDRETKASAPRHPRRRKGQATNLLGSFEESVLNGRLEPVSTVQGFTAELGASGSFTPKQLKLPVTVFFYTVGDYQRMSSPYLCHIKLEKKGYCVPKVGTFQMTLKNPNGSVVKMFVILYDLSDMPPNSKTFMRQRILFLPTECKDESVQRTSKWLKYLIHLRFASSKSGKLYLHGDIRIIVLNKADLDTANAHDIDTKYEMRTITLMPINPRYSLRK